MFPRDAGYISADLQEVTFSNAVLFHLKCLKIDEVIFLFHSVGSG
jgi:hypothetical protein